MRRSPGGKTEAHARGTDAKRHDVARVHPLPEVWDFIRRRVFHFAGRPAVTAVRTNASWLIVDPPVSSQRRLQQTLSNRDDLRGGNVTETTSILPKTVSVNGIYQT